MPLIPGAESAPPESAADVAAYLIDQHQQIADSLEAICRVGSGRRSEAFTQFRRLLAVHEATERHIVHPRTAHELADGRRTVSARLDEEQELRQLVSSIETREMGNSEVANELDALRARLLGHMRREEELEFAGLRIQLGSRQLRRMSNAVELAADPPALPALQGEVSATCSPTHVRSSALPMTNRIESDRRACACPPSASVHVAKDDAREIVTRPSCGCSGCACGY